jgi:RNA polymerase-interacting CarD/CdnL/TRCF family regulator
VSDERYVHPRHGICRVLGRQERTVGDGTRTYVELQVDASPSGRAALTMLLPEDELMEHVREVASTEVAEAALKAMKDRKMSVIDGASSWRVRVAKAEAAIEDGDLVELGRVLRDLVRQDHASGLSNSERRVADHVRDLVVGELVGALGWTVEEAAAAVNERVGTWGPIEG